MHHSNVTADLVRGALAYISAHLPRDDWAAIGMAIKSEFPDDVGFHMFDRWSESAGEGLYDKQAVRQTWKSIKAGGGVGIGTLFKRAQEQGFVFPKPEEKPASVDPDVREREARERAKAESQQNARIMTGQAQAASRARREWEGALSAFAGNMYATRKGIEPIGVRFERDGTLLVPMCDGDGLQSLQRIAPDGAKRYLPNGKKSGCWFLLGTPGDVLLLAEGYATGVSLHMATGHAVAVAFDAGNLQHVAKAMRREHPTAKLVICADDDVATAAKTGRNPGMEKAHAAAKAVKGVVATPAGLPEGGTDFNDLHVHAGLDAVQRCVQKALDARARPEQEPAPKVAFDPFTSDSTGVWFQGLDRDGQPMRPAWVCSPLQVAALTRNPDGNEWGYELRFTDQLNISRTWAMPARMLAGDGTELRSTLLNMGLRITPNQRDRQRLAEYIQTRHVTEVAVCTDRLGWHGPSFVLPTETIGGDAAERVVYQTDGPTENQYRQRGTLAQWQERVGALCVGNSRLAFAVCVALAGPTMRLVGMESGGIHIFGDSSSGKTTSLKVAASVYGSPEYVRTFRATDNATEAIAAQFCDNALFLDEMAQMDAKAIGDTIYMLANGMGKARANRNGAARAVRQWTVLLLSTGEIRLADHMSEGGKRIRAGQETRLVDIPADAGVGLGAFEQLHHLDGGSEFSRHMTKQAASVYGTAGRAWLEWLTGNLDGLRPRLRAAADALAMQLVPELACGQVQRVGARFALVGAAGELATEVGITGWPKGEATKAATACFNAWLAARGGIGNSEVGHMLRQVRRFLELHAEGRFSWWHRAGDDHAARVLNRAGVRRLLDEHGHPIKTNAQFGAEFGDRMPPVAGEHTSCEFFILAETFKAEVCNGFDHQAVAKVLQEAGCLVTEERGRYSVKTRLPGIGPARCYRINSTIYEVDA